MMTMTLKNIPFDLEYLFKTYKYTVKPLINSHFEPPLLNNFNFEWND